MRESENLNQLELLVLSAIQKLESEAFVPRILDDLEKQSGRATSARTLYAILSRMDEDGLVTFRHTARLPAPGGRSRKLVRLTTAGRHALRGAVAGRARVAGLVRAILDRGSHAR